LLFFSALCFSSLSLYNARAQNTGAQSDTLGSAPAGFSLPSLPDPGQNQAPLNVHGSEAQSFRFVIPESLYPMIRADELSIKVLSHSLWDTALSGEQWNQAPTADCLSGKGLAENVSWTAVGFPCGSRITIEKHSNTEQNDQSNEDKINLDRGRRYLLNAERSLAASAVFRAELRIQSTGVAALTEGAMRVERVAPALIAAALPAVVSPINSASPTPQAPTPQAPTPKSAVIWREKLSWLEPKPISGAGMLTLRFRGADEDMVFQRSAVSTHFRQLTGSNRGDEIYGLPVSADDIAVWSSKIEWLETANFVKLHKMLVPIFGEKRIALKTGEVNCSEAQIATSSSSAGDAIKDATALNTWAANLIFVPREVAEIEVTSGDPFSLIGKMRVFIDAETMLPIMKIVYDRAGQQERVIIGSIMGLSSASAENIALQRNIIGPLLAMETGAAANGVRRTVITPEFIMLCDNYSQTLTAQIFDLRNVINSSVIASSEKKAAGDTAVAKNKNGSPKNNALEKANSGADAIPDPVFDER